MKKNVLLFEQYQRDERAIKRMRGMGGMFSREGAQNPLGPWYVLTSTHSDRMLAVSRNLDEIEHIEAEFDTEIRWTEQWLQEAGLPVADIIERPDLLTPGDEEEIESVNGKGALSKLYSEGTLVLNRDWQEELELWRYDSRKWDYGGWSEEEDEDEE
jgi:hypothetical protein